MAGFAPLEHAQSPQLIEPAHRLARRSDGETQSAGQGHNRKLQAELADDERMTQQIGIDGALLDRQPEARRKNIFKLHPQEFSI